MSTQPEDADPQVPTPIESTILQMPVRKFFELMWGDTAYTRDANKVYQNIINRDGSLRVCRLPLDTVADLETIYPPGNKTIHVIRIPGENFAIVYDYNDWINESVIRRLKAIEEVQVDIVAKHKAQLRRDRFNRMIYTYIRLGRMEGKQARDTHKIVLSHVEGQFLDFGEAGVEQVFKSIEATMSRRLEYSVSIYEQPDEEESEQDSDPIQ